jgi:uncharacterized protein YukJ
MRPDPHPPHYRVDVEAGGRRFQVHVSVKPRQGNGIGAQLLYAASERFAHPILALLHAVPPGFRELPREPGGLALDYIRRNLLDRRQMARVPLGLPGQDDDLSDKLDHYVVKAIRASGARLFAWGEAFTSGRGVHNVHMNQGNPREGPFGDDNGVYQDGGLLLHFPDDEQWVAFFLAFQTQAWHTDDGTGHPVEGIPDLGPGDDPAPSEPDHRVRIVAAQLNPIAKVRGTITLLNTGREAVSLVGWRIADRMKRTEPLSGTLEPGGTSVVVLQGMLQLGDSGGILTLLDDRGLKVHGVAYTDEQASREGETIVF